MGVTIVRSARPAWQDSPPWTRSDVPVLEIGQVQGDPAHELFGVTGAIRFEDGDIAIVNGRVGEIRFFDADGAHLRTVGGDGEGPGEYRRIEGLWRFRGDSLLAWDRVLGRWTVMAGDGSFGRVILPRPGGINPASLGPLDDGTLVVADLWLDAAVGEARPMYEYYLAFSPDGTLVDSIGRFPSFTGFATEAGYILRPVFGPRTVRTAGGDGVWVGEGTHYEVVRLDARGTLRERVRWDGPDRAAQTDLVQAYRSDQVDGIDDPAARRQMLDALDRMPVPDSVPAYDRILVDRTGTLWLESYDSPGTQASARRWTVIDADGEWLGSIDLPLGFIPLDIGIDYIAGVGRDELDVEHVRVYELVRN